jgi:hypothetical protein
MELLEERGREDFSFPATSALSRFERVQKVENPPDPLGRILANGDCRTKLPAAAGPAAGRSE